MTAITKITDAVVGRVPSAPFLIGGIYCLCVLAIIAIAAGSMLVTDEDPFRSNGPVAEIVSIGAAGTTALIVGVLAGLALARSPGRARVSAIVFGALAIITVGFFWSGAPGIFGLWPPGWPDSLAAAALSTVSPASSGLSACASRSSIRLSLWVARCSTS